MKTLHLKLKKDVLIVDVPELTDYEVFKHGIYFQLENGDRDFIEGRFKLICKGSELTEEIAKGLVKAGYYKNTFFNYNNPIINYNHFNSALDSLISAIEANGYYWKENPEKKSNFNPEEFIQEEYERFMEVESHTLKNPLIFVKNI